MKTLIGALEDLELDIRNMADHLQGEEWLSKEVSSAAVDAIIYGKMAASAVERLRALLEPLVEAKEEVREIIEEEEGGEDLGEQVPEPEDREAGPEVPVQEPEPRAPKGSKRVRKREG